MAKKGKKKTAEFSLPESASSIEQFDPAAAGVPLGADVDELADVTQLPAALFEARRLAEEEFGISEVDATPSAFVTNDGRIDRTNVVGTAVGRKEVRGVPTDVWAVKYYVSEKVAKEEIADGLIPSEICGFRTDVVKVGEIVPQQGFTSRLRPAPCGSSCGHVGITFGTIGALCIRDERLMLLSNNHVLANTNAAQVGQFIVQPGPTHGGIRRENVIAQLEEFVRINFAGQNRVDAAIAWTAFQFVSPQHHTFTMDPRPLPAAPDMAVLKDGARTGRTVGEVAALDASVRVNYGTRFNPVFARFTGQIDLRGSFGSFSDGGDSGALIVHRNSKRPIGLLFAGDGFRTWANPIQEVLSELSIDRLINAE